MTEALLLLSAGSLLTISMAALIIATACLRHACTCVQLAEECMEHLREEQARLPMLLLLREERHGSQEEQEEWYQRPSGLVCPTTRSDSGRRGSRLRSRSCVPET